MSHPVPTREYGDNEQEKMDDMIKDEHPVKSIDEILEHLEKSGQVPPFTHYGG